MPPVNTSVSVLSLSQNRVFVRTIDSHIRPHGYLVGGVLESDPFSEEQLAIALRVLEPRPQALLIGKGYSDSETAKARNVFASYMRDASVEKGTVIKITPKVIDEVGKDGVPYWVLNELNKFFES